MTTPLKEQINNYKEKELDIMCTREMIREIEQKMVSPLKNKEQIQKAELEELGNQEIVSLSVRELLAELAHITGISQEDMYLDIDYTDMWTVSDIFAKTDKKPQLRLIISSKSPKQLSQQDIESGEFYYSLAFESDFREPQADGKILLDHSYSISEEYDDLSWPSLYIRKEDIMDIICHFKLEELVRQNAKYNHNLLEDAIENHIKNKEKFKVKEK